MICVDHIKKGRGWGYEGGHCHLFDDDSNLTALNTFAGVIGLERRWLQMDSGRLPHYDLTKNKRRLAIQHGAIPVKNRFVAELLKKLRLERSDDPYS